MKHTDWVKYIEGRRKYRIRAEYGFHKLGNQNPYFAVTGEIERYGNGRWREDACGCIHDDVAKHFPKLAPLIRWHLCDPLTGPMHYKANGLYWWNEDNMKNFQSTIVAGAVDQDFVNIQSFRYTDAQSDEVGAWLDERLPDLLVQFKSDIDAFDPTLWPQEAR